VAVSLAAIPADSRLALWLAAFLGAASVPGFAPYVWFPLPILSLALLFALLRDASSGRAWVCGFAYGLGLFLAGVSWIYVSLSTYGGMPPPLAILATLLFCAVIALFPAAGLWLGARLSAPGRLRLVFALPAAWTLLEWTRGWLFTGFPWLALGYSQVPDSPLAGFAPLLGVYGVGLLAALSAGLLTALLPSPTGRAPCRRGTAGSCPGTGGSSLTPSPSPGGGGERRAPLRGGSWVGAGGEGTVHGRLSSFHGLGRPDGQERSGWLPTASSIGLAWRIAGSYHWYLLLWRSTMETARLFASGRSQAVRLPKEYRFTGTDVVVKHFGNGVLLLPMDDPWLLLEEALSEFEPGFRLEREQPLVQARPEIGG